jgi:hypothetical protein
MNAVATAPSYSRLPHQRRRIVIAAVVPIARRKRILDRSASVTEERPRSSSVTKYAWWIRACQSDRRKIGTLCKRMVIAGAKMAAVAGVAKNAGH